MGKKKKNSNCILNSLNCKKAKLNCLFLTHFMKKRRKPWNSSFVCIEIHLFTYRFLIIAISKEEKRDNLILKDWKIQVNHVVCMFAHRNLFIPDRWLKYGVLEEKQWWRTVCNSCAATEALHNFPPPQILWCDTKSNDLIRMSFFNETGRPEELVENFSVIYTTL